MVDRRRGGPDLSLAEVLPIEPETRPCSICDELLPIGKFTKATWDDETRRCSRCRAPRRIPDPEVPPTRVLAHLVEIPLSDDMRARAASGVNFRVELVLHIDYAQVLDDGSTRWKARWLEVSAQPEGQRNVP
jgi:hypothetical protein